VYSIHYYTQYAHYVYDRCDVTFRFHFLSFYFPCTYIHTSNYVYYYIPVLMISWQEAGGGRGPIQTTSEAEAAIASTCVSATDTRVHYIYTCIYLHTYYYIFPSILDYVRTTIITVHRR